MTKGKALWLKSTEEMIRKKFENEGTGHDWWHIDRVRNMALTLAKAEGADLERVELGALLHDIADHKFHDGNLAVGPKRAAKWMEELGCPRDVVVAVKKIVEEVSFKGAGVDTPVSSLESACVQDADRLDAIGAIGVARCFAYGGSVGQVIHDPTLVVEKHDNFERYSKAHTSSVNHFYEKLLLLKDRMNTDTGKSMAAGRHQFMLTFLEQLDEEWKGMV